MNYFDDHDTVVDEFENYLQDDIPKDFCDLVGQVNFLNFKGKLMLSCKFCEHFFFNISKFLNHLYDFHLFKRPFTNKKIILDNKLDKECQCIIEVDQIHIETKNEDFSLNKLVELSKDINPIIPRTENQLKTDHSFYDSPEDTGNILKNLNSNNFIKCLEDPESKKYLACSQNFSEYQPISELPTTLISSYEGTQNLVYNGGTIHSELPIDQVFHEKTKDEINSSAIAGSETIEQFDKSNNNINKQNGTPALDTQEYNTIFDNISTTDLCIRFNKANGTYDLINCSADLLESPGLSIINKQSNENSILLTESDCNIVENKTNNKTNTIFIKGSSNETSFIEKSANAVLNKSETQYIYRDGVIEKYHQLNKCKSPAKSIDFNIKSPYQKNNDSFLDTFQKFVQCQNVTLNSDQTEAASIKHRKIECKSCSLTFNTIELYELHVVSCKKNKNNIREISLNLVNENLYCSLCNAAFPLKIYLERHMEKCNQKFLEKKPKLKNSKTTSINNCSKTNLDSNNYKEHFVNKQSKNNLETSTFDINSTSEYNNQLCDNKCVLSPSKYINYNNGNFLNNSDYDMDMNEVVAEVVIDNDVNLDYSDFIIPLESAENLSTDLNVT